MTRLPVLTALASLLISSNVLAAQSTPPVTVNQLKTTATFPKIVSKSPVLKTTKGQISYSIGADLAENFKEQGIDVDPIALEKGLADRYS